MSFKELLKGTRGEPRAHVVPERAAAPAMHRAPAHERPTGARATSVLYVAADPRETRMVTGAFTYDHPELAIDLSTDLQETRPRLAETGRYDVLVIGWTVPEGEAVSLIKFIRALAFPVAIVGLSENGMNALREAGADHCVQKSGTLLTKLPGAIEDAVKNRTGSAATAPAVKPAVAHAPPAAATSSPAAKSLRVAFGGEVEPLKAALGHDGPSLHILPLAQALREADVRAAGAAVPFDVIVIDHSAGGRQTTSTLSDVRARNLDVPVVLVVDPREERAVLQAFEPGGSGIDEFLSKTTDWQTRLAIRLETVCARYQQQRELATLRVKESRLRALVDKLPACVVRLSPEGTVLATNGVAMSLLGVTQPQQLLRKPFASLVAEDARDTWSDFVARVASGEQRSCEIAVTTIDGVSRTVEATAVPSPAEGGASSSVVMVLRDVSDRKRLEAALEDATARLVEPELPLAPAPEVPEPAESPLPDGRVLRDLEADLHHIADRARTTFDELGALLHDMAAQHDEVFTRQVDAYTKVKAEQLEHWRSYESFIQGAANGIARVSLDDRLQTMNPPFAASLGYGSPEEIAAAAPSISQLTDETRWRHAVERWRAGSHESIESPWRRKDGALVMLRLRGRIVASPDGASECVEIVAEDVSAQRALETQLRRARRWEDAARVTSGIAADLTHLMAAIKDAADRLHDASAHDDAVLAHVSGLRQSVSRALALCRQLVAFGRKEARDPQAFDLNGAVRGLEPVLRRLIDEHIELTLALTSPLGTIDASQPAIEEAVVHLAMAAANALPAGGQIEITTLKRDVDALDSDALEGVEPGRYAVLSITASGWGLDADVQDRDEVRKGLAAARRILGPMGVSVSVDGVPRTSLTLSVYVPRAHAVDMDGSEEFAQEMNVMPPPIESAPGTARVEM